jgi:hypothetical protein
VLVETPKAAVKTAMPMEGISVAELRSDVNLQLALRGGVAESLDVTTDDVQIASMSATTRRRLAVGVSVEFEVAIPEASVGAVVAMTEKIAMQATTFDAFIKAEAADLGVLDLVASLVVQAAAITAVQATIKMLPATYVATATLPASAIPTFAPTSTKVMTAPPGTSENEMAHEGLVTPHALQPASVTTAVAVVVGCLAGVLLLWTIARRCCRKQARPQIHHEVAGGGEKLGERTMKKACAVDVPGLWRFLPVALKRARQVKPTASSTAPDDEEKETTRTVQTGPIPRTSICARTFDGMAAAVRKVSSFEIVQYDVDDETDYGRGRRLRVMAPITRNVVDVDGDNHGIHGGGATNTPVVGIGIKQSAKNPGPLSTPRSMPPTALPRGMQSNGSRLAGLPALRRITGVEGKSSSLLPIVVPPSVHGAHENPLRAASISRLVQSESNDAGPTNGTGPVDISSSSDDGSGVVNGSSDIADVDSDGLEDRGFQAGGHSECFSNTRAQTSITSDIAASANFDVDTLLIEAKGTGGNPIEAFSVDEYDFDEYDFEGYDFESVSHAPDHTASEGAGGVNSTMMDVDELLAELNEESAANDQVQAFDFDTSCREHQPRDVYHL